MDLDEEDDDFDVINLQANSSSNNYFYNSLLNSSNSGYKSNNNFNELDFLRDHDKPSGLKNIGNTCWFNSIIQAFFHLPYLRDLILTFNINESDLMKLDENVIISLFN